MHKATRTSPRPLERQNSLARLTGVLKRCALDDHIRMGVVEVGAHLSWTVTAERQPPDVTDRRRPPNGLRHFLSGQVDRLLQARDAGDGAAALKALKAEIDALFAHGDDRVEAWQLLSVVRALHRHTRRIAGAQAPVSRTANSSRSSGSGDEGVADTEVDRFMAHWSRRRPLHFFHFAPQIGRLRGWLDRQLAAPFTAQDIRGIDPDLLALFSQDGGANVLNEALKQRQCSALVAACVDDTDIGQGQVRAFIEHVHAQLSHPSLLLDLSAFSIALIDEFEGLGGMAWFRALRGEAWPVSTLRLPEGLEAVPHFLGAWPSLTCLDLGMPFEKLDLAHLSGLRTVWAPREAKLNLPPRCARGYRID